MAGPFSGMDPYFEDPVLWPGVHQGLITGLRNELNRLLPPGYVADMGERIYVVQPVRSIYRDFVVFEQSGPRNMPAGSVSAAALADPPVVLQVEPMDVREVFVEIVAVGEESRVVTVIELLSPANKGQSREGRDLYLSKQRELLGSNVHLEEIDLLRSGEHTAAAPRQHLGPLGLPGVPAPERAGGPLRNMATHAMRFSTTILDTSRQPSAGRHGGPPTRIRRKVRCRRLCSSDRLPPGTDCRADVGRRGPGGGAAPQ